MHSIHLELEPDEKHTTQSAQTLNKRQGSGTAVYWPGEIENKEVPAASETLPTGNEVRMFSKIRCEFTRDCNKDVTQVLDWLGVPEKAHTNTAAVCFECLIHP